MKHIILLLVLIASLNASVLNSDISDSDCRDITYSACKSDSIYMHKLIQIAKLKSTKSWRRLIKSGNLYMLPDKYKNNELVLMLILCASRDTKRYSNAYGSEINNKGRK